MQKEGLKQPFIKEPEWGETPRFEETTESHWVTPHEREVKKQNVSNDRSTPLCKYVHKSYVSSVKKKKTYVHPGRLTAGT